MSLSAEQLDAIQARLSRASGESWRLAHDAAGNAIVEVKFDDGRHEVLRVDREAAPANAADVAFIANSRGDLARLIETARGRLTLTEAEVADISARADAASPTPWKAFLESAGGIGGESVIWVSERDEEPDMYLRLGRTPAPDQDYEFVAASRQDIERLLRHTRPGEL